MAQFWENEVRIRWVVNINPAQAAHTYEELISESKATILKYSTRDRAIMNLLHIPTG